MPDLRQLRQLCHNKLMEKIFSKTLELLGKQHFDSIAVGRVNLAGEDFEGFTIYENAPLQYPEKNKVYFDLASLTKPLTLAANYLQSPEVFTEDMKLLLNHRAGLPSWGRLDHDNWKTQILNYKIKPSDKDVYSDFSALRLMLEIEEQTNEHLYDICKKYLDEEVMSWLDLPEDAICPITGTRNGEDIRGKVHDDNAFVIGEKVSHAGLFGTLEGVCRTLINLNKDDKLIHHMSEEYAKLDQNRRFVGGWDRVTDPETSLAGSKASLKTFGHLGFTGTSIWIDLEKEIAAIILSNATKNYWYDKDGLATLRREIGELLFS